MIDKITGALSHGAFRNLGARRPLPGRQTGFMRLSTSLVWERPGGMFWERRFPCACVLMRLFWFCVFTECAFGVFVCMGPLLAAWLVWGMNHEARNMTRAKKHES